MIILENVRLPEFGQADVLPGLSPEVYRRRLERLRVLQQARGLDVLVLYADREHFANVSYLTGFDPRFEEAILLIEPGQPALLLVGNECMGGHLPDCAALNLRVACFGPLSLMGQARDTSHSLRDIFMSVGVKQGRSVGCIGWKYEASGLCGDPRHAIDLPAYLVDALRELTGDARRVVNATDLLMNPEDGLRIINEPVQIAQFEFAATTVSQGVAAVMRRLRPGVREMDMEPLLDSRGLPLSCHRTIGFGDKARRDGMASPSGQRCNLGDVYKCGFGVNGALTARGGVIAHGPEDLPVEKREGYASFISNYFAVVAAWYRSVAVGRTAGQVYDAIECVRDDAIFSYAFNPGHYLHLDEWVHSPFVKGSQVTLKSGMAIQADIIPVTRQGFFISRLEDGVALADASLRAELEAQYPAMMARVKARRAFMAKGLGIEMDESVLPLSNTPAWLPPYVLNLEQVLVCRD